MNIMSIFFFSYISYERLLYNGMIRYIIKNFVQKYMIDYIDKKFIFKILEETKLQVSIASSFLTLARHMTDQAKVLRAFSLRLHSIFFSSVVSHRLKRSDRDVTCTKHLSKSAYSHF